MPCLYQSPFKVNAVNTRNIKRDIELRNDRNIILRRIGYKKYIVTKDVIKDDIIAANKIDLSLKPVKKAGKKLTVTLLPIFFGNKLDE